jgi:hypothetical protein
MDDNHMVTGCIWEKVVFGRYLFAPAFYWEDVFSMFRRRGATCAESAERGHRAGIGHDEVRMSLMGEAGWVTEAVHVVPIEMRGVTNRSASALR